MLDVEGRGYLLQEELAKYMTEEGTVSNFLSIKKIVKKERERDGGGGGGGGNELSAVAIDFA